MILIGIGANLPSERYGSPVQTCEAALDAIDAQVGLRVVRRSRWFESAPVPISDQPWYVNGVCIVESDLEPADVLQALHDIEADFGRVRAEKNAARVLDLDLLVYDDFVSPEESLFQVPHPRLHERGFVLLPMLDLVPGWVHPKSNRPLNELIAALLGDQIARPIESLHISEDVEDMDEFDMD